MDNSQLLGLSKMRFSLSPCLILVLVSFVSWSTSFNSTDHGYEAWSKLEISSLVLYHMDYGYKQIDIYSHAKNNDFKEVSRKKYYFVPLGELNADSAVSKWNDITRNFEVDFQVSMWNQKLKRAVWEFLEAEEPGLKIHQVQVLPVDKVALRCQECRDFIVQETPLRHSSLPHKVYFKFLCITRQRCDDIASHMKSNPRDFSGLNLVFALQNQRSESRKINIASNVAFNGELFTRLRNEFPAKSVAFLTSDDEKKLIAQSVQEVQAEYVSDSDILGNDFAQQVKSYIERLLLTGREDTTKFKDESWESVFWEQDTARPDVLANELNEIHSEVNEKVKGLLEQIYNEATKTENTDKIWSNFEAEKSSNLDYDKSTSATNNEQVSASVEAGGWGVSVKGEGKSSKNNATTSNAKLNSKSNSKNKYELASERDDKLNNSVGRSLKADNATEFLKKTKNIVSWNGKKFIPKPMTLTRVNIGSLDSATRISSKQINLKYYSAALITAISISDDEPLNEKVVIYQEIDKLKKDLSKFSSKINDLEKALMEKDQQWHSTFGNMRAMVMPKLDWLISRSGVARNISEVIENLPTIAKATEPRTKFSKLESICPNGALPEIYPGRSTDANCPTFYCCPSYFSDKFLVTGGVQKYPEHPSSFEMALEECRQKADCAIFSFDHDLFAPLAGWAKRDDAQKGKVCLQKGTAFKFTTCFCDRPFNC